MEQQSVFNECGDMFITSHLGSEQLPGIVQDALKVAKTPSTKDMLLLSVLTNAAYAVPKMRTYHGENRHDYGPDLMTMVLAPAASGKGVMNYGRRLLRAIEGEHGKQVYIPANASGSALIALLQRFQGRGIIMATEMDTLSQALKSGYGQFSDALRCMAEHETISQLRRQNNEFIEIKDPHVSILLSGTLNQLTPLIKSRENGLASRFACYVVREAPEFEDSVWDADRPADYAHTEMALYDRLSEQLGERYVWMESHDYVCRFALTDAQRQRVKRLFRSEVENYIREYGESFRSIVHRMPVVMKRIGMILTGLRLDMSQPMPEHVTCSEDDFNTMALMGHKLLMHAALMYDLLPEIKDTKVGNVSGSLQQHQFLSALPEQFSKQDAEHLANTLGVSVKALDKWLTIWTKNATVQRVAYGSYKKMAS